MNVTTFLAECRGVLEDTSSGTNWSDALLLQMGDRHIRGLHRKQVEMDDNYHNAELILYKEDWRQVRDTDWELTLPSWVTKITNVRWYDRPSTGTLEQSPLDIRDVDLDVIFGTKRDLVPPADIYGLKSGYRLISHNTIRLQNYTAINHDLFVEVAKLPARMLKATLPDEAHTQRGFFLPATLTLGTLETETDAYRNALFTFDPSTDTTAVNLSVGVYRCVASQVAWSGATRITWLAFEENFGATEIPLKDQIVESVLEIPDQHCRLLVLLTALSAYQRKHNIDGMRTLQAEIAAEYANFLTHIKPRQLQEPQFMRTGSTFSQRGITDPDRDRANVEVPN